MKKIDWEKPIRVIDTKDIIKLWGKTEKRGMLVTWLDHQGHLNMRTIDDYGRFTYNVVETSHLPYIENY